jgi:nucleoside-diphosphate-sugar epimerase
MSLRGKRVLVTGGAGFIGSHLVDELILHAPETVIVVDNFFLGHEFIQGFDWDNTVSRFECVERCE